MKARILVGDCLVRLAEVGPVDAALTDPPYGMGRTGTVGSPTKWARRAGRHRRAWDDTAPWLGPLLALGVPSIVWGGNYFALPPSRCWLCWRKPDAPPSMSGIELAWTSLDATSHCFDHSISATNAERVGHPTQKPVALMAWCIERLKLPPGSTILDPYMGSGSTGVAALRLGMNFVGIEIDPEYAEIARRRMAEDQPLFGHTVEVEP